METYLLRSEKFHATDANLKTIHGILTSFLQSVDPSASPSSIGVCGSYLTRTLITSGPFSQDLPAADLYMTIPITVCSEADINKGTYEEKRAAFCQSMVDHINQQSTAFVATTQPCFGRPTKTVVKVIPGEGALPLVIHPRIDAITEYLVKGYKKRARYINGLLEDVAMPSMLQLIHTACATRPNYVRCILMLKAWAAHNGITPAANCPFNHSEQFQPFVFAILIALLHKDGIISPTMSEENVLRTVWVQLARGFVDGPSLYIKDGEHPLLNILHRTSQRFIDSIVKPASEEALKQSSAMDIFNAPRTIFPMHFSVVLQAKFTNTEEGASIIETVNYALQDRLVYSFVELREGAALIFARIRGADGRNKLVKGPSLEQTSESEKFSSFWGASSVSTRQFSDGSIHKCVSLVDECLASGRTALAGYHGASDVMLPIADVTLVILQIALRRKLPSFTSIEGAMNNVADALTERLGDAYVDTAPLANKALSAACAEITTVVNKVQSTLACKVTGFDIVSGSARECDPYPIRPHASVAAKVSQTVLLSTTPSIEPVYCILGIDDKSKIPDTLDAIKAMKGALCAQLSNALVAAGFESHCTTTSVDIIAASGYVFRIYIAHFREVSLLRALERAPQADMLERKLFWSVQHHKYVRAVLTEVHMTFSKAARLAKRWVAAMLLGDFVAPEAIELLVARSYLVNAVKPRSAEEGFYRFLQLLSQWNWARPLPVDPTVTVDHKKVWDKEVMGMVVLAPYDNDQLSPFTQHTPRPMIVHRLSMLATGAVQALEEGRGASLWLCDIPSSFDVAIPLAASMALASDRCILQKPVAPTQYRLWRAGDLSGPDRQRYITQLCELEPANFCLRTLRGATRDKCMLFMDIYGPQSLAVVSLSQNPTPQLVRSLVESIMAAAPPGSLGHISLPPLPEVKKDKPRKEKAVKTARDSSETTTEPTTKPKKARAEVAPAVAKKSQKPKAKLVK